MLQDQTDKVKLFMSCTQLKPNLNEKVDPLIRVHIQDKDMWNLIGETELLKDCQEPKFGIPISVDFSFGTQQTLLFEIINFSSGQPDLLGIARATLGKIINAPKHFWVSEILDKEEREVGKLIIQRQRDGQARKCLSMQWAGVKLMNTDGLFDKSDPYLKFFKERHPGEFVQVHETEVIMNKLNPVWRPFEIMSADLADGEDRPIKVECWDWEKKKQHQFIGDCMITLGKLLHNETEFELHNPKKKKKTGKLRLLSLNAREEPGFLDFLLGGQSLKLFIGMNFSSPGGFYNCDANSSHILHDDNSFNEFQNAMYAVSEAVLEYDVDQSVPMYGFGGIPKFPMINSRGVSNCFPCSGNPNQPRAVGLEGIMNTYSHAVQNVDLGGSTNVAPLLKEVMQFSQVQKRITNGVYTVLVMLMNSDAQDIQQAINYLVDSSQLPLSVLFVGIGEGPFIHMENLNKELVDSTGKKAQRHLAQFVTFKDFKGDVEQFTQFVMEKIPGQLVEYMKSIGKRPGALIKADLSQVENSGRVLHTMQTWSPAYKNASFALTMTNQSFEKWKKPGSYGNILNMTEVSRTSASNLSGSDEGENVPAQNSEQDINVQNMSILKGGNFTDEREIQTFNRYSIEPHPMSNVNEKPLMSRNPLAELNFGGNEGKDSVMTENQSYHPQIYPTFENNDVTMIK